jgi:hypothetical protein
MMEILGAAVASFRIQRFLWIVGLVMVAAALLLTWWIALALVPVLLVERYFAKRRNKSYMLLSALMLSYEMIFDDFGGLAKRFPGVWKQVSMNFMAAYEPSHWSRFLDIYLPARDKADPASKARLVETFLAFE